MIEYNVQGQTKFEGAFIATNEQLIMNVDMNGQFIIEIYVMMKLIKFILMVQILYLSSILEQFQCVKLRQKMYKLLLII